MMAALLGREGREQVGKARRWSTKGSSRRRMTVRSDHRETSVPGADRRLPGVNVTIGFLAEFDCGKWVGPTPHMYFCPAPVRP
jgi:hypothetical protein